MRCCALCGPRQPLTRSAASKISSTSSTARSPIAWTATCRPAESAAMMPASSSAWSVTRSPLLPVSRYGSAMSAVREPRLPSANAFTVPQLSMRSGCEKPRAFVISARSGAVDSGTAACTLSLRRPPLAAGMSTSWRSRHDAPGSSQPISWTCVTPWDRKRSMARSRAALRSSRDGAGSTLCTRNIAESLSSPVGRAPPGARTIAPPGGSAVSAVTPARAMAAELASALCLSACSRYTGLLGLASSIHDASGGPPPNRSERQPWPSSHEPGGAPASAASTAARRSSRPRAPERSSCAI
mmetsp:Transcript_2614/g.6181  ORF Transcript_2614/g.6181 Transcript_2614/m.6181 type:complete len:298 (+) Transcript_2614:541-1434(+)